MFTSDIFFSKSAFTSADKIFCFQSRCLQFALWEWVFVFDFNYFCQRSGLLGIHSVCSLRSWLVENYFFREAGAGFSYFGRKVFRQADECVLNFCWLLHPDLLINAPFTCYSWFAYDWLPPPNPIPIPLLAPQCYVAMQCFGYFDLDPARVVKYQM